MAIDPTNSNELQRLVKSSKPAQDLLKYVPEPYKEVAKDMEQQFLEFMISQMKDSIDRAEDGSTAMNYYEGLLTQEQASQMASKDGGIGIQKMILDQIYPQNMRNEMNYNNFKREQEAINRYKANAKTIQGRD